MADFIATGGWTENVRLTTSLDLRTGLGLRKLKTALTKLEKRLENL